MFQRTSMGAPCYFESLKKKKNPCGNLRFGECSRLPGVTQLSRELGPRAANVYWVPEFSQLLPLSFLLRKVTNLPVVVSKCFTESHVKAVSIPCFCGSSVRGWSPSGSITCPSSSSVARSFLPWCSGRRESCPSVCSFLHPFMHSFVHPSYRELMSSCLKKCANIC